MSTRAHIPFWPFALASGLLFALGLVLRASGSFDFLSFMSLALGIIIPFSYLSAAGFEKLTVWSERRWIANVLARKNPQEIGASRVSGLGLPRAVLGQVAAYGACPPRCIWVAEDAISPPDEMKSISAAIPNAQFVEIPEAGHMTTMENPTAVNRAMTQFLASS